jgi:hypothetical protein
MNYARIVLINLSVLVEPLGFTGFQYAGLTCCVISVHNIFAIVGGLSPVDLVTQCRLIVADTPCYGTILPNPFSPSY